MDKENVLEVFEEIYENLIYIELSATNEILEKIKNTKKNIDILYKYININKNKEYILPCLPYKPFDFNILKRQIEKYYDSDKCAFSIDDVISIFSYFIEKHESIFGKGKHLPISNYKLQKILQELHTCTATDGCDDDRDNPFEYNLEAADYYTLIDKFFASDIESDYSLYHFMSGNVRGNILRKLGGGV